MKSRSNGGIAVLNLRIPLIALILAATAIPVHLRPFDPNLIDLEVSTGDVVANVLGYIPVGIVLANLGTIVAVGAGALISLIAEVSQIFTLGRYPSPLDVAYNVIGSILGVAAARILQTGPPAIALSKTSAIAAAVPAFVIIGLLLSPGNNSSLGNWDPQMQFGVADEFTRDRAWYGEIHELAIVPAALDASAIQRLAAQRSFAGLAEAPIFGRNHELDLSRLRGQPLLTPVQLLEFHDSIVTRGAFTVLVRFRTDAVDQTGPARIVTYSRDQDFRNFTLAQEKRTIVFRVRTPTSGLNGLTPQIQTDPILAAGRDAFVAATYDGRLSRVFLDGVLVGQRNLQTAGKPWLRFAEVNLPVLTMALAMLISVSVIVLVGRRRPAVVRSLGFAAGIAVALGLVVFNGRSSLELSHPSATLAGLTGGAVVAISLRKRAHLLYQEGTTVRRA